MNSPNPQDKLSVILSNFWEAALVNLDASAIPPVLERIKYWVGEQPALTKALCEYVIKAGPTIRESDAEADVDAIVQREIINGWQDSLVAPHLNDVEDMLLGHDRLDSLLILYIQVLQRGPVPANSSPEQMLLLESGLVKLKRGKLQMANRLYGEVFDLSWVEQQLPGITKPVSIVSPKAATNRPSATSKLYSKLAIAVCGVALLGAAISSYIRESGGQAMANSSDELLSIEQPDSQLSSTASETLTAAPTVSEAPTAAEPAQPALTTGSDRVMFDNGEEHAKNSRWVLMMREFCSIPENSAYYAPAQKHLEQWATLYGEDLKIARDVVAVEKGGSCAIADSAISQ